MATSDSPRNESNDTDSLDWFRENRERVEALAESDRRSAKWARAVLDYLDNEQGGNDGNE